MTENKRKYYMEQLEKIYNLVETNQDFTNAVYDLVELNIEIEMAQCPFQLSKEQADMFRIRLFNMDAVEIDQMVRSFLDRRK